jgi:hypothetical protein
MAGWDQDGDALVKDFENAVAGLAEEANAG